MARTYRNNEERIYTKILKQLKNTEMYHLDILEDQEERYAKHKGTGDKSEVKCTTHVMEERKLVLYIQKLLAAVISCEPAICRGDQE